MKNVLLTLFIVGSLLFSFAQEVHPIDVALDSCLNLEINYTTQGMKGCMLNALGQWDNELNTNYQELVQYLTADQKKLLLQSQREWIVFRDKELDFSNKLYNDMQGTMWIPVKVQINMQLTRQRAIELGNYLFDVKPK